MQLAIFCNQEQTAQYKGTFLNEKLSNSKNQFLIQIPIYQTSQCRQVYAWATMCYEQGSSNLYSEGEIIVVDFINDELNYPIIIGKLYRNALDTNTLSNNENITLNKKVNSLIAVGNSTFNAQGFTLATYNEKMDITSYKTGLDLINAITIIQNLQQKISNLEAQVENLKNKVLV